MDPQIPELGQVDIPPDFPYREVLEKGRPCHDRLDPFRIRHPQMDPGRRAKIFAPFDALKGFNEAIRKTENEAAGTDRPESCKQNRNPEY